MYCEKCGARLEDNTKFCMICGHKVDYTNDPKPETPELPPAAPAGEEPVVPKVEDEKVEAKRPVEEMPAAPTTEEEKPASEKIIITSGTTERIDTADVNSKLDPNRVRVTASPSEPALSPKQAKKQAKQQAKIDAQRAKMETKAAKKAGKGKAAPVADPSQDADVVMPAGPTAQVKKKSPAKTALIIVLILALLLAAAVVSFFYLRTRPTPIKLSKYVDVVYEGADGYGRVSYEFNDEKFLADNRDKIKYLNPDQDQAMRNSAVIAEEFLDELYSDLSIATDADENLSNGDQVFINFDVDEDYFENLYKVDIKADTAKKKVEGLLDVEVADPSQFYEVLVEGMSPNASLSLTQKADAPAYLDDISVSVDKDSNLKAGDEVTLTFDYDEDQFLQEHGLVLEPTEIKIPIDGIAGYITSLDELSEEDQNELIETASSELESDASEWTEASLSNNEYVGAITISPKEGGDNYNDVFMIYKQTATENIPSLNYNYDFGYFSFVKFTDVLNSQNDDLYKSLEMTENMFKHRINPNGQGNREVYYKGYYFMELLLEMLNNEYDPDYYDYDLTFDMDDYRLATDGTAGDYLSNEGPMLRLAEDGKVYYIQRGDEALEGTWREDGSNFYLDLVGINGGTLNGSIDSQGRITVPDQRGWTAEIFTKLY